MKKRAIAIRLFLIVFTIALVAAITALGQRQAPQTPPPAEYTVSGPYTYKNLSIFLLHGSDQSQGRAPLTLQEAMKRKLVVVRETEATMMMILLAGFAATLHGLTGQDDICIQSTLSQRSQRALERMIGVVANSLILRLDLAGRPSFRALVRRTQATVAAAFEHGAVPVIDRAPHAIRRINFNFTHGGAEAGEPAEIAPGLRAHDVPIPLEAAKTPIDLHLWLFDRYDGIALRLLGNEQLFRRETCELVLRRFTELLARAGRDPAAPIPGLR